MNEVLPQPSEHKYFNEILFYKFPGTVTKSTIYFFGPLAADYNSEGSYDVLRRIGEISECDVIAIDLYRLGLSQQERYEAYSEIGAELIQKPRILAYSNGAVTALELVAQFPELKSRLVVVAPATIPFNTNRLAHFIDNSITNSILESRAFASITRRQFKNELINYANKILIRILDSPNGTEKAVPTSNAFANLSLQYSQDHLLRMLESIKPRVIYSNNDPIGSYLSRNHSFTGVAVQSDKHNLDEYEVAIIDEYV